MEAILRDSFVRDASGKNVPNTGPFEPTLVAELAVFVGDDPFVGFAQLKLPQNSRATHGALDKVTKEAIDDLLKEMATSWTIKNDG
ncbi:hypothetical protein BJL95_03745 [Methylomonas sp. LWB]|uniref:hypothetical protein n=1 Tax=Methylomonas sp. LWB TaxID=1905845 RepID=UPI0008D95518|nr:hypothetical protein [Methylomonas sp. LWB]OHX34265.1 hypothetical protein BJL95_03745 [Methylomonas sp. LWB]